MKRVALTNIDYRAEPNRERVILQLGTDHFTLAPAEAVELANQLVDAAEDLTAREEQHP